MKVHWTQNAIEHLVSIFEYIIKPNRIEVIAVIHGAQLLPNRI